MNFRVEVGEASQLDRESVCLWGAGQSGAESLKSAFAGAGIHMLVTQVGGCRGDRDGLEVEGGKLRDGRCP